MSGLANLLTPTILLFSIIVVGYFLGKLRVHEVSLDLSAILIVSVFVGYLLSRFHASVVNDAFESNMDLFSKLGTALFVSAIGISAGISTASGFSKRNVLSFFVGVIMVLAGFATMKLISCIDQSADNSLMLGVLCGALTSTPGLSSACEVNGVSRELAVLGYGSTYIFSVICVVVFVQLMTRNDSFMNKTSASAQDETSQVPSIQALIPICLAVVLGTVFGNMNLPRTSFSLGASGGILCMGLLIGLITRRIFTKIYIGINKVLPIYRNLGLVVFFVGSGIPAGAQLVSTVNLKWIIYGILIVTTSLAAGYMCSCLGKRSTKDCMSIVAGGMTSTPAIGVLLRKQHQSIDLTAYSAAYVGALLTITIIVSF